MRRPIRFVAAFVSLAAVIGVAHSETLPLPASLIGLDSEEGADLLIASEVRDDYFPLSMHFVTQANPAFCGPASIAMVLNALEVPRPPSDLTAGFGLYDQANIFDAKTEVVKPQAAILTGGMTLDQLGGILEAHGLKTDVHHAADSNVDQFRDLAKAVLADDDQFVLVNYLRSALGQEKYGHISPLAAYDADTDRFLILDVTRYKYPPIWVETSVLFQAMNTSDSDNADLSRGFLIVGR